MRKPHERALLWIAWVDHKSDMEYYLFREARKHMARHNPGPPLRESQIRAIESGYGTPQPHCGTQARDEWWEHRKQEGLLGSQFQSQRGYHLFDYRPTAPWQEAASSSQSSSTAAVPTWVDELTPPPPRVPRRRKSPARNMRPRDGEWEEHGQVRDDQRAGHAEILEEMRNTVQIAVRHKAPGLAMPRRSWQDYRDDALGAASNRPGQIARRN